MPPDTQANCTERSKTKSNISQHFVRFCEDFKGVKITLQVEF